MRYENIPISNYCSVFVYFAVDVFLGDRSVPCDPLSLLATLERPTSKETKLENFDETTANVVENLEHLQHTHARSQCWIAFLLWRD